MDVSRGAGLLSYTLLVAFFASGMLHAQSPAAGYYIGHPRGIPRGGIGESIELWSDGDRFHTAKYGDRESDSILTFGRTVRVRFTPNLIFYGHVRDGGFGVRGRMVLSTPNLNSVIWVKRLDGHVSQLPGHITLSGMRIYAATTNGASGAGWFWNTRGGYYYSDLWINVYMFTNRNSRPVFLNGGDSDASLNPNLLLAPGTHTIHFAGTIAFEGLIAINLHFNNTPGQFVAAFGPQDASGNFNPIPAGIVTFDQYGSPRSNGTLSLSVSNLTVTLTDFRAGLSQPDLVGGLDARPDGGPDTFGYFTLTVTRDDLVSAE